MTPKLYPALRAKIGTWSYYITTLSLAQVAEKVRPAGDILIPSDLNQWIQREVIPLRIAQIAEYLINRDQHFFPTIVVGIYFGEPTWHEIDIEDNLIFTTDVDQRANLVLGFLELNGTERLYAIDGQHRVAGIKEALTQLHDSGDTDGFNRLSNEDLSVIFVSANIDRPGQLQKVRRLFTTLNKEAKKVTEPEIVALDEDDAAAIVTRWLATYYDGLKGPTSTGNEAEHNLIQFGRQHEIRPSNPYSITTIVTLYRMIKNVFQPELKELEEKYDQNRPEDDDLDALYQNAVLLWELLRKYDTSLCHVIGTDPKEKRAAKYRTDEGGHILFRPIGLQAFSGALGVLKERGVETEHAIKSLCQLPTEISEPPWVRVLWNPTVGRMMPTQNRPVAEGLFLHMLGHPPRRKKYQLNERYSALLGNPEGNELAKIPVYSLD